MLGLNSEYIHFSAASELFIKRGKHIDMNKLTYTDTLHQGI